MIDLEKMIQKKVAEALEGSFMDAQVYGVGFIKIEISNTEIDVLHVPHDELEQTLQQVVKSKN